MVRRLASRWRRAIFFLCIGLAAKKETIDTDPDKVKAATKATEGNLNRHEDPEKIIEKLEEKGIKDSNFAKVVDDQVKTAARAERIQGRAGVGLSRAGARLDSRHAGADCPE